MNCKPPATHHVTWDGNDCFIAENTIGQQAVMQAGNGHKTGSMNPLEFFIVALGGCPLHDITEICREQNISLTGLKAEIRTVRHAEQPTVFACAHVHFTVSGAVDDTQMEEIIREVMTLRCPVAVSFGKLASLTWSHRTEAGS